MKQKTRDMTQGKPAGIIVSFAIPLMLGNVFQQMYTVMDSVIVGRGVGVEALAALGTSDWISFTAMGGNYRYCTGLFRAYCTIFWGKRRKRDEKNHCYVSMVRSGNHTDLDGFVFRKSWQAAEPFEGTG